MSTRWRLFSILAFLGGLMLACAPRSAEVARAQAPSKVLDFSLPGLDGELVESKHLLGRVTVLLFLTTFDVASQAQARRLEDLHRMHVPRLNALGIVVEAPRYATLASEYQKSLGLSYPLVMGERAVLDAHQDLRNVKSVPAWIVLDREGQVVSSAAGSLSLDELEDMVSKAEAR